MRGGPCVIVYGQGGGGSGCSARAGEFTVDCLDFGSARYLPPAKADSEPDEGWIRISDNLVVKPKS